MVRKKITITILVNYFSSLTELKIVGSKKQSVESSFYFQTSWFVNSRCYFSRKKIRFKNKIDFYHDSFSEVNDMQIIMHVFTFLIRTRLRS